MQTLKYREARLSERSRRPGRVWGSAPAAPLLGTCKSGPVLRQWVPNLLQIKKIKHTNTPVITTSSITGRVLAFCATTRVLCPRCFQCWPPLSSIRLVHCHTQTPAPLPTCTPLPPASPHAKFFPARTAVFDTVFLSSSHKNVWGPKSPDLEISSKCLC